MSKILKKEKELVVPGEVLAEGMDYLPSGYVFREGEKIIADTIGLVNIENRVIKLIPLTGSYIPRKNDVIIGKVVNITFSGWMIDIGHSNLAMLTLKEATSEFIDKKSDLSRFYDFNDVVMAKIVNVNKDGSMDLTMKGPGLMKLNNGRIIRVGPNKIPRVIGKQGSMINIIKTKTNCKVMVGQNGNIWIQGNDPKNENKAIEAIKLIEKESAKEGLTEKVEKFLK